MESAVREEESYKEHRVEQEPIQPGEHSRAGWREGDTEQGSHCLEQKPHKIYTTLLSIFALATKHPEMVLRFVFSSSLLHSITQCKEHWAPSQETYIVSLLYIHSVTHLLLDSSISESTKQMVVMVEQ